MATRSLTEVFVLMRNNAIRNRHIYSDQDNGIEDASERMQLISLSDMENGLDERREHKVPPVWVDQLEESQFTLTKLKTKIEELKKLQDRHLHRPTFDESSEEEVLIENCTSDITVLFNAVHRLLQFIKSHSIEGTSKESHLTLNVIRSLGSALQELSNNFRASQSGYLKKLQSREERSKLHFDNPILQEEYDMFNGDDSFDGELDAYFVSSKKMSQQQLLFLEEENTRNVRQREQEVNAIVRSIVDLNEIFKDLSRMVSDHGTVLDRIDYNIEQTQTQVYEGFKQLQKADAYQRKNRKMYAIIVLATTTILMLILMIIIKF